jgi:hypothetical protein
MTYKHVISRIIELFLTLDSETQLSILEKITINEELWDLQTILNPVLKQDYDVRFQYYFVTMEHHNFLFCLRSELLFCLSKLHETQADHPRNA